ncbi:putative GH43/DUF377 family glycosyl hydrolase [Chitinophaga skermanii]|uniref:Putative GH43/DUF377 family glycosyl hydrolase n=1 Tax=Chitinophaga skermanii TaxID=331697 RepID=A0A327QMU0_9BACT|nr:glycoside hydrolase family 130 protein [Chitinophaga skermanii]RAJ05358.1 putative GH43/DUF377 family glycosyl hydrolase [Chitinophaga skermanii]
MQRYTGNPILTPASIKPSHPGLEIACLLNPGAFEFDGKIWLILRVAERPQQLAGRISFPILVDNKIDIMNILHDSPSLVATDPRVINYNGDDYLTTLSHLRLVCSTDGVTFTEPEGYPPLYGEGPYETFGIEDCRVSKLGNTYYLTYTAVSPNGVGVGLRTTKDWKTFTKEGIIIPPHNKDCAIFEELVNGKYYCLHRPSSVALGGNYIWLAESPDGIHWGKHICIARTRPQLWDSIRLGAGCAPIKTSEGWLVIYHGANDQHQYCLGTILLDLLDPTKVIARSVAPIMQPTAPYELTGFFGHVIFTNGHIVKDDEITMYYGAADDVVCMAKGSVSELLHQLKAGL